jgi:hypothetical protein
LACVHILPSPVQWPACKPSLSIMKLKNSIRPKELTESKAHPRVQKLVPQGCCWFCGIGHRLRHLCGQPQSATLTSRRVCQILDTDLFRKLTIPEPTWETLTY